MRIKGTPAGAGGPAAAGGRAAGPGQGRQRGGEAGRGVVLLGQPVEDGVSRARPDGLKAEPHPGRRPRLSKADKRRLVALLTKGAAAAGYPNDLWTCRRVADLIGRDLRRVVRPRPRLEDPARLGVEFAEARGPGPRAAMRRPSGAGGRRPGRE